jgi:protein-L-isoaspartate(D-aspartate) O-methyltransferase
MVTAAAEDIPQPLVALLADGGKMMLPIGPPNGAQRLVKLTKLPNGELTRDDLVAVRFVPLLPGKAREL